MVRKANIVQKQELGGGKGCAEVHEIVPEKDLYGHGKLYAKVVLKPNSSVGWHRHVGETEPYYILTINYHLCKMNILHFLQKHWLLFPLIKTGKTITIEAFYSSSPPDLITPGALHR